MNAQQLLFETAPSSLSAPEQVPQLAKPSNYDKQVWIAVCFPLMALTACQSLANQPFVVIQISKGQMVIYNANELALNQGVMLGMPLNAAYALCHDLKVRMRNEPKEAEILEGYAKLASRFTPNLALSGDDVLLLEVSASFKLFGGVDKLINDIGGLYKQKHTIAATPIADASQLLVRNGISVHLSEVALLQSALGSLSLSSTPLSYKLVEQLNHCGIFYLKEVWRLPQADLARRFGPALPKYLDLLSGKCLRPYAYYIPPVGFDASIDLPSDTDNSETLLIAAQSLLDKAEQFLRVRSAATQVMIFSFIYVGYRSEGLSTYELNIRSQQASCQKDVFLPQLIEQLQSIKFDRPVIAVSLKIDQVLEHKPGNAVLFGQREQNQQDWQTVLDLLSARLGESMIYRLQPLEDHRPEKAWKRVFLSQTYSNPLGNKVNKAIDEDESQAEHQIDKRPLWLLPKPVPYNGRLKSLNRLSGPERIEAGWWQGQDVRRDYCSVKTASGVKAWLYQDIYPLDSTEQPGQQVARSIWYVHGLFA